MNVYAIETDNKTYNIIAKNIIEAINTFYNENDYTIDAIISAEYILETNNKELNKVKDVRGIYPEYYKMFRWHDGTKEKPDYGETVIITQRKTMLDFWFTYIVDYNRTVENELLETKHYWRYFEHLDNVAKEDMLVLDTSKVFTSLEKNNETK